MWMDRVTCCSAAIRRQFRDVIGASMSLTIVRHSNRERLRGASMEAAPNASDVGDHVDFHERVSGNPARGGDRGAHRRLSAETPHEHLVHFLVILQVIQKDPALKNLV